MQVQERAEERYYIASQWTLMGRKFRKHKAAVVSLIVLIAIYVVAVFAEFFSPYDPFLRFPDYRFAPPQRIRFIHEGRFQLRPFVYGYTVSRDPDTLRLLYKPDPGKKFDLRFFVRGPQYRMWGLLPLDLHLFGVQEPGVFFLLGSDDLGRDVLSRVVTASRISLSIGLLGVASAFVLGCFFGGISGYFGGTPDLIIQRVIEFLVSVPTIPLWMALSAALPPGWPPLRVYFGITIILSVVGWSGLARVVRGKFLELREEDFVMAARISGAPEGAIIVRHLIPSFMSYLIVYVTLAVPGMILGETALSFLGIGLRAPVVSWGVLLQSAQNVRTVALYPWLMLPAVMVIVTVLMFNFIGDGLRDAADPYH